MHNSNAVRNASRIFYFMSVFLIITGVSLSIVFSRSFTDVSTNNINLEQEITKEELLEEYKTIKTSSAAAVHYDVFEEAVENSKFFVTNFTGKLTHYGPDCPLCSGKLACNGQDARGGNIYYNDKEYGTVRIVATTKLIPCGSIIRINIKEYAEDGMYAIVLDRGVSGSNIDLLKESQQTASPVRTVNGASFDIVRYGY